MPEEDKSVEGDKGHPEVVPWSQHVAAKETISNKLKAAEEKASSLEEQLKNAPNKEEFDKITTELADAKQKLEKVTTELNQGKEKTANELREALKGGVFSEEELKSMSEAELRAAVKAAGSKPTSRPDLTGGGGSSGELKGSPMDLARQAYERPSKK